MKLEELQKLVRQRATDLDWTKSFDEQALESVVAVLKELLISHSPAQAHDFLYYENIEHCLNSEITHEEGEDFRDATAAWVQYEASAAVTIEKSVNEVKDSAYGQEAVYLAHTGNAQFKVRHDSPTKIPTLICEALAYIAALCGVPVEVSKSKEDRLLAPIIGMLGEESVICIPQFQYVRDCTYFVGAVCVVRQQNQPPLTELEWYRTLLLSSIDHGFNGVLYVNANHERAGEEIVYVNYESGQHRGPESWYTYVDKLDSQDITWTPPLFNNTEPIDLNQLESWLGEHVVRLGLPTPSDEKSHPAHLRNQLEKVMQAEDAESFSAASESSAMDLSQSAAERGWVPTVVAMIATVQQTLDMDLQAFVGYVDDGRFEVTTCCEGELDLQIQQVLRIIAQTSALQGVPAWVAPGAEPTPVHAIARKIIEADDYIVTIPVYRWGELDAKPVFHGIFVGLRNGELPPPTEIEWMQWQFLCQCMGLPLDTLAKLDTPEKLFRPLDVDLSQKVAKQIPDRFLYPKSVAFRTVPKDRPEKA